MMKEINPSSPVAVARYSDHTFTSKEYITTDTGDIRAFYNIESAHKFLQTVFKIPDDQLEWFMYDSITICGDCKRPYLEGTVKLFTVTNKVICEHCYFAP